MVQGAIVGRRKVLAGQTASAEFNVIVFRGLTAESLAGEFQKRAK
jgi:hypothetical protein